MMISQLFHVQTYSQTDPNYRKASLLKVQNMYYIVHYITDSNNTM